MLALPTTALESVVHMTCNYGMCGFAQGAGVLNGHLQVRIAKVAAVGTEVATPPWCRRS
jgi:hypothetical protein